MTTLEFFNQYFGRHLVAQTGDAQADATRTLSSGHKMANTESARVSRRLFGLSCCGHC